MNDDMRHDGRGADAMPALSVVVPCRDAGAYLDEAVASVRAFDLADVELLIVDDGSSDPATRAALDAASRSGATVLRLSGEGLSAARNAGARNARAPYVMFLDADDVAYPSYARKAVAALDAHPDAGFAYPDVRVFGAENYVWRAPEYHLYRFLRENPIHSNAVVRRTAFEAVGGFDVRMHGGFEDWAFWIALGEAGSGGVHLPEVLAGYRRRSGSMLDGMRRRDREAALALLRRLHAGLFGDAARVAALRRECGWSFADEVTQRLKDAVRGSDLPGPVRRSLRSWYHGGRE